MANYDSDIRLGVDLDAENVQNTAQRLGDDIVQIFDKAGKSKNLDASFQRTLVSMNKLLNKSKDIQEQMQKLEGKTLPTGEYESYEKALDKLMTKYNDLQARMEKFIELGRNTDSITFRSMEYDAERLKAQIQDIHLEMKELRDSNQAFIPAVNTAEYDQLVQRLNDANNQMTLYINKVNSASILSKLFKGLGNTIKTCASKVADLRKNIVNMVGRGIISGFKKLGSAISNLGKHAKSSSGGFEKGFKSFIRYGLGVRSIFALVNKLRRALFEGFGDLAQVHEPFNRAMSSMMTALNQLKNSFAAAFAPLIETVSPILTEFINKMSQAVTLVGQFIAALTGKEFVKAGTVQKDYAESVAGSAASANKAAKATSNQAKSAEKLKKTLAGFDDVEILKGPDEDSSSSTPDTGDAGGGGVAFSTAPIESSIKGFADKIKEAWMKADFFDLGRILGQKLKDALDAIPWDEIQSMAWKIARSLATFLNGFISTPGLFDSIGKTLAQAFNTALLFLYTFLTTFNWAQFGKALATGLNSFVKNVNWELLGYTLKSGINGVFKLWYNFVSNFDFSKFGKRIGDALSIAIKGIDWKTGGASVAKTINGLFDALNGFIKNTDWKALGKSVVQLIGSFFKNLNAGNISSFISNIFIAIYNFWQGVLQEINWEELPGDILKIIGDFFKDFDYRGLAEAAGGLMGSAFKALVAVGGSLLKSMKEFGESIMEGGFSGILEKLKSVGTWIKEHIFDPFVKGFKEAFGIASPSKEMKPLGENIIDGLFEGITNVIQNVKDWIGKNIVDPFVNGVTELFGLDGSEPKLFKIGGQLIDGLKSGITGKLEDAGDWIDKNVTGPIKGFFETGFGINNNTSEDSYEYGSSFIGGLDSGMSDNVDTPVTTLSTLEGNMENVFVSPLESWKTAGKNLLEKGIKPGLESFGGKVKDSVESLEAKLRGVFPANKDNWKTAGSDRIDDFREGLEEKTSDAKDTMQGVLDDVSDTISDSEDTFTNSGENIIGYIDDGLSDTDNKLSSRANTLAGEISDEFDDYGFETVGSNIGIGIYNGLIDESQDLLDLAWDTATNMFNEACRALGIASPSKKFAWIGKMTMNGLAGGIEDNSGNVLDTVSNISTAMEEEAEKANPTITLTDSVDDWIGKLDDVLTKFGSAVTDKFDALMNSMTALTDVSMYPVPAIAQGRVVPPTFRDNSTTSFDLKTMQSYIQALLNNVINRDELQDILTDVISSNLNIEFYLGDEQIARHANSGNLKLGKRYNR